MDWIDNPVLSYNLFDADRDSDVVVLANRMLTTRSVHACVICGETIPKGTRVRAQSEVSRDENKVMRFYVCVACCDAIALRFTDGGRAIEERTRLGTGFPFDEEACPGHVGSQADPKICSRCGIHIDDLRPDDTEGAAI